MVHDSQSGNEADDPLLLDRRTCLRFVGLTAAGAVATTEAGSVTAATSSSGYGEAGYSEGEYGGSSTESALAVSTAAATNTTESIATLDGELTDLGGASSVDVAFEYRVSGSNTWTTTGAQSLTTTGTFSVDVDDLTSATEYEFRATASASDGDTTTGGVLSFTTETTASPPAVDQFDASESGSPNPHAEISVDWAVSDPDADLRSVGIVVRDPQGELVRSVENSVSGATASGSEAFKIKQGGGTTYDCTITVTDSQSHSTTSTESVSS